MHHTYLMEKGEWTVRGSLVDAYGEEFLVSGVNVVEVTEGTWKTSSTAEAPGVDEIVFPSTCVATPPLAGSSQAEWQSQCAHLGDFSGLYIFVKDSILSTGESVEGGYVVSEWLQQLDSDRYINRGVLLKDGVRVSSWAMELERGRR